MKTLAEQARQEHRRVQDEIMHIFNMDELEHNSMLYEHGLRLLRSICNGENDEFNAMSRTASFWKWYRNEWYIAQNRFLQNRKTFTFINAPFERTLYNAHMEIKCVQTDNIFTAFDNWLDLQIRSQKNTTNETELLV